MLTRRVFFSKILPCFTNLQQGTRISSSAITAGYKDQNRNVNPPKRMKIATKLRENKREFEDTFGNLDDFETQFARIKDDPEDILEYQRSKAAQGKTVIQYIKEIKSLLAKNDYKTAIKVFEVDMVNDKIRMNRYIYKLLINYNALNGNLEECYRLYIKYKERGGFVTGAMYTSMFNACANCSNSLVALKKANAVRDCMMRNENHAVNNSNYNAMLKAYGRHCDIKTCLEIIDEVFEKRDKVKAETFSFLIQACISDKNSGLRHALLAWRKMLQNKIKPSIFSFNLMLRCVRECSLGDVALIPEFVEKIQKESNVFYRTKVIMKTIDDKTIRTVLKIPTDGNDMIKPSEKKSDDSNPIDQNINSIPQDSELIFESTESARENSKEKTEKQLTLDLNNTDQSEVVSSSENSQTDGVNSKVEILMDQSDLPNFLSLKPSFGSVIKFGALTKPYERFMLVGGVKGFLNTMKEFGVAPDLKTFTLMLNCVPSTVEAEELIIAVTKSSQVKLDVGFFNVLLKRRILRQDDIAVKECLEQMHSLSLSPDILTFGILALGCRTRESGQQLLQNIAQHGYRPNPPILDGLLKNATSNRDMHYILDILKAAKENESELDSSFLARIARFIRKEQGLRKKEERENENQEEEIEGEFQKNLSA